MISNITHKANLSGIVFGILAGLPFIETLVYNTIVGSGTEKLHIFEYFRLLPFIILLLGLMVLSFVSQKEPVKQWLQKFKNKVEKLFKSFRKKTVYILLLLPIIYLILFFGDEKAFKLLYNSGILFQTILPVLQLILSALVIFVISILIRNIGEQYSELEGALDNWAFSLKMVIPFYLLLIAGSWKMIHTIAINPDWKMAFLMSIIKDYILLFIISNMFYLGIYKIASAEKLKKVFQSNRGLLHFIMICGIISILAVWADFNSLHPDRLNAQFLYPWQKEYNKFHVYFRDIVLLFIPISAFLFWVLRKLAMEVNKKK